MQLYRFQWGAGEFENTVANLPFASVQNGRALENVLDRVDFSAFCLQCNVQQGWCFTGI